VACTTSSPSVWINSGGTLSAPLALLLFNFCTIVCTSSLDIKHFQRIHHGWTNLCYHHIVRHTVLIFHGSSEVQTRDYHLQRCLGATEPFHSRAATRTLANSFPRTFAPWPFHSLANSLPDLFAPWNFCSVKLLLP